MKIDTTQGWQLQNSGRQQLTESNCNDQVGLFSLQPEQKVFFIYFPWLNYLYLVLQSPFFDRG